MKKTTLRREDVCRTARLIAVTLLLGSSLSAQESPSTITIDAGRPGARISPHLFGIFFEEINHAGDGGLYAELVRNRSFEDRDTPEGWSADGPVKITLDADRPLNAAQKKSLRVEVTGAGGGVSNGGYWGMAFEKGARYRLSFHARAREGFEGSLNVALEGEELRVYTPPGEGAPPHVNLRQPLAEAEVTGLSGEWKSFTAVLEARASYPAGRLRITAERPGTYWLDVVSLFPEATWKGRPNGLRPDLARMLDEIQPAFVRFPGGCFVEGNRLSNATRWKQTIGDIAERPGHLNQIWSYRSTDGLGYHEYLQMCEDLGAAPLFVINCGMAHEDVVPMGDLDEWIQDALDAVEYASGPPDSRWGALRARHGHPAPFGLKYLEIGNENGGPAYEERYARFWDALKKGYPELKLIANVAVKSRPMDILDEHYYSSPEFFRSNASRYDGYDRQGPRIYVGEYACTQGCGNGNLIAALGEAAFMAGMERNSDVVVMASYAPLFVHVNDRKWNPDSICFDSHKSYGTPSYHVQKLFSRNRGDRVLPAKVESRRKAVAASPGAIGLGTWSTQAEYKDLKVEAGGQVLFESAAGGEPAFKVFRGDWKSVDGAYRQSNRREDMRATAGDRSWTDYTYSVKARKIAGAEGFLIMFRVRDDRNWYWWNIGGWGNTRHAIEKSSGGSKTTIGRDVAGGVESGRWYDVKVELAGARIRCFLDGRLIHDVEETPSALLEATAGLKESTGEIILKVVSFSEASEEVAIRLLGGPEVQAEASTIVLTSAGPGDENSLEEPEKVAPKEGMFRGAGRLFNYTFPARSLTVLRIGTAK
jgi:alpha-L-arabinofuranosidase